MHNKENHTLTDVGIGWQLRNPIAKIEGSNYG